MQFDTFLFDLDGTLIDSLADLATAVNRLRDEFGLRPLDLATVRGNVGDGAAQLVRRSLPPELYQDGLRQRFLDHYRRHLLERTVIYPGIGEFLQRHRHHALAVVTNKPLALARALLEGLGLAGCFAAVIGGDSCPAMKPAPDPLLQALAELDRPAAAAVMIGDHHTDLRAGRAAGVATCFCGWGFGHDDGLVPDFRAMTPPELLRHFP